MSNGDNKKGKKEFLGVKIQVWGYAAVAGVVAWIVLPKVSQAADSVASVASAETKSTTNANCAEQAHAYAVAQEENQSGWGDFWTNDVKKYEQWYDTEYQRCIG